MTTIALPVLCTGELKTVPNVNVQLLRKPILVSAWYKRSLTAAECGLLVFFYVSCKYCHPYILSINEKLPETWYTKYRTIFGSFWTEIYHNFCIHFSDIQPYNGKWCPSHLKAWHFFLDKRKQVSITLTDDRWTKNACIYYKLTYEHSAKVAIKIYFLLQYLPCYTPKSAASQVPLDGVMSQVFQIVWLQKQFLILHTEITVKALSRTVK